MAAKALHRLCSILALVLMLWMGLSGLAMQAADLVAIATHQRGDSPTRQATDEGKYGGGGYTVISLRDYAAAPIPAGFDYPAALRTVLGAAAAADLPQTRFVEQRTANGRVVGNVINGPAVRQGPMIEQPVASFDAATGRAIAPVAATPQGPPVLKVLRLRWYSGIPQVIVVAGGANVTQFVFQAETGQPQSLTEPGYPPSRFPLGDQAHQSMKRFHSGSDYGVGARLLNLFAGLALVYLAVSGLVLYVTMWRQRRRTGRPALIWR